jgi:hypothetical protein
MHHSREGGRQHDADCQNHLEEPRTEDRQDQEAQQHAGESHQDVHEPHDHVLDPAPGIAGHQAQRRPDHPAQQDRAHAHQERDPPGEEHAGENVAAEWVTPQYMRLIRGLQAGSGVLNQRIVRREERRGHRQNGHQDGKAQSEHSRSVPEECPPQSPALAVLLGRGRFSGHPPHPP